jgi:hypothetical protein
MPTSVNGVGNSVSLRIIHRAHETGALDQLKGLTDAIPRPHVGPPKISRFDAFLTRLARIEKLLGRSDDK